MQLTDERLVRIRGQLAPEVWEARVEAARAEATDLEPADARVREGEAAVHVMRELFPDRNPVHMVRRLRAYQARGVEALIDRRFVRRASLITPEVMVAVRAALAADPELRSRQLCDVVRASLGVDVPGSTMRQWLRSQGLSQRSGPPGHRTGGELGSVPIANAGAELLKAVDEDLGATQALTDAMTTVLAALPAPVGPVHDDRAGRDEGGRFTAAYNAPQEREDPDLGSRFGSVAQRREQKDLRRMRVAQASAAARHRKDLALTYLPIVVEGARWSELQHWRGEQLDTLAGHAFQPSTLDKYARELKLAGVSRAMQHAVASFWAKHERHEGGAAILYCDTFTKPIWTRHYALSTRVARTGRVQPAVSTLFLHSGAGTPLLYESYPGHVSLPKQVCRMLGEWEAVAGVGTAQRLVVLDREAHSAALFKELDAAGWLYLVPVRQRSARPESPWEEVGPWVPLDPEEPGSAEVRDAQLWLNDSKGAPRFPACRRHPRCPTTTFRWSSRSSHPRRRSSSPTRIRTAAGEGGRP